MLLRCLARRTLSTTRVALTGGPAPFNALPGSFLNGEDGREMLKKPEIGPVGKEEVRLGLFLEHILFFEKRRTSRTSTTITTRSPSTMRWPIATTCVLSQLTPVSSMSNIANDFC